MVSLGRVLFSFLQSLGRSEERRVGNFFFFFFAQFMLFLAREMVGGGWKREKGGLLTLLGWPIVLASLESGYLEKGNDDW